MTLDRTLLRNVLLTLAVSLALAVGSFGIRRQGPEMGEIGNVCGPAGDQPCYVPLLSAGWPLAFVVDAPGVSVPDKLGFEDDIRPGIFVVDVLFYFSLLSLAWRYGRLRRRIRDETRARRTDPR